MAITNKSLGNDFETRFCEKLFEKGFWVHNMTQNSAGQPADVIAVRDGKAYLIDCKVCTGGRFSLNRIEENQHNAMKLWKDSGNGIGWFALEYQGSIFMVDHDTLVELSEQQMSMNYNDICCHTIPLEGWLLIC